MPGLSHISLKVEINVLCRNCTDTQVFAHRQFVVFDSHSLMTITSCALEDQGNVSPLALVFVDILQAKGFISCLSKTRVKTIFLTQVNYRDPLPVL